MKNIKYTILLLLFSFALNAQVDVHKLFTNKYGIEIEIDAHHVIDNHLLSLEGVTLDHGSTEQRYNLYVTQPAFEKILQKNILFKVKEVKDSKISMKSYNDILKLKKGRSCLPVFDFYPTYEAYEQLMYDFEAQYPDICKIINIKTLSSGRKLLIAQIGDNLNEQEFEPNVLYTSSMHGDELAGYPTMLMLIDYLLCNYGNDDRLTKIVDNVTLFINPLANPNGTYTNDNSTVVGARRENGSFIDLNRNFPDPLLGENPDNRTYQEETLAFIQFSDDYDIHLSCNMHGGAELANYPWDAFSHRHADDSWWEKVCRNYADTVHHNAPSGYLTQQNNGITFGFDWYEAHGTRQDHMTFFKRGREFTLEMSNQKLLNSDELPDMWQYHKNALINYIEEATFGIRGSIVDCLTGLPIKAEIIIFNHDKDNSSVFSNSMTGHYFRLLDEGNFDISFIAEGYDTLTYNYNIIDKSSITENIELCPNDISMTIDNTDNGIKIMQSGNIIMVSGNINHDNFNYHLLSSSGEIVHKMPLIDKSIILSSNLPSGIYYLHIYNNNVSYVKKLLLN